MTTPKPPAAAAPKDDAKDEPKAAKAPEAVPDGREGTGKPDLPADDPGINAHITWG